MKNLFSLDDFIAAAISGIGYGLGYYVPERLGWHPVIALAVCMVSGGFLDYAVHRMLHRRFLQNSTAAKFLLVVFFVALLFAVNGLSYVYLGISLFGSYIECIIWVVAFELLGLAVSSVRKLCRKRRIRRKYGISPSLFVFSEKESNRIGVLNGENRKIDGDYDKSLAVQTITGTFVGKKKGGVVSYLGIPYAKPPTGTLRWKAPENLPPSSDVFEAFYPGASPVQIKSEQNIMRFHRQSEDCLYLNIRKSVSADRHQKPRKVIVYVFGGDGSYGSSVNPIINGFNLIKKNPDLIFINFNYRFGMLGFADFSGIPGGENYPDANHLGLLDIISALKWVKNNIAAFGGDPDSITLAADTAGSSYVLALSLIEQSKNLFSKVILFSTAIYAGFTDKASLIDVTGKEIEELGVNTMEELVNLPQEKIAGTYEKYAFFNAPVLDGKFVPENIFEAFRQKKYGNIEFVFGFAENELSAWSALVSSEVACLFSTNAYNQIYRNAVSDAERNIMKSFVESRMKEGKTEQTAKTLFAELLLYRYHTLCLCNILSGNGSKVRCFLWKAKSPGDVFNANIVSALTTIMGNSEVAEAFGFVIDESLSAVLQSLLKKFICNEAVETFRNEIKGMPAVEWPEYKVSSPEVLVVSDSGFSITRDMGIQELNGFSI